MSGLLSDVIKSGCAALWLDGEFHRGASGSSTTFANDCLASGESFECNHFEAWSYK